MADWLSEVVQYIFCFFCGRYTDIKDVISAILNHPNPDVQSHVRIGKDAQVQFSCWSLRWKLMSDISNEINIFVRTVIQFTQLIHFFPGSVTVCIDPFISFIEHRYVYLFPVPLEQYKNVYMYSISVPVYILINVCYR